jgi:hypothetical protein
MKIPFDQLENHEPKDTASYSPQPTRESPNMIVNICLPECDGGLGIGFNMRPTMKCVVYKLYQEQSRAAA